MPQKRKREEAEEKVEEVKKPKLKDPSRRKKLDFDEKEIKESKGKSKENVDKFSKSDTFEGCGVYSEQIKIIKKETIHDFLTRILGVKLSKKVLADFTFSEDGNSVFTVVGRPDVPGSSKVQMRHVTPFGFVKHTIEERAKTASNPQQFLKSMISFVLSLLSKEVGAAVWSDDLAGSNFDMIREGVTEHSSKHINTNVPSNLFSSGSSSAPGQTLHMVSPQKVSAAFQGSSPRKKAKAEEDYAKYNSEFTSAALRQVSEQADHNATIIAAEALARIIFILFNKRDGVAYPEEGNTMQSEIRYYKKALDAKAKNTKYEVLTIKELLEKSKTEDINGKVNFVDCEGARVKNVKKALDLLNDFIDAQSLGQLEEYNSKFNAIAKLTNEILDPLESDEIGSYNKDLSEKLSEEDICYHVAKQLFRVFDYKALEDTAIEFVRATKKGKSKDIHTSFLSGKYKFTEGGDYRETVLRSLTANKYNQNAVFRTDEEDDEDITEEEKLTKLAEKIVEHGRICTLAFSSLSKPSIFQSIIEKFGKLVGYEHDVDNLDFLYKTVDKKSAEILLLPDTVEFDTTGWHIGFSDPAEAEQFASIIGGVQDIEVAA